MATRRKRSLEDLQRHGPMQASSRLPTEQRPTFYTASGFQAPREAAQMTVDEVAQACGYDPGVIASIERGVPHHTVTISRAASVIPGHNLSLIRDE